MTTISRNINIAVTEQTPMRDDDRPALPDRRPTTSACTDPQPITRQSQPSEQPPTNHN